MKVDIGNRRCVSSTRVLAATGNSANSPMKHATPTSHPERAPAEVLAWSSRKSVRASGQLGSSGRSTMELRPTFFHLRKRKPSVVHLAGWLLYERVRPRLSGMNDVRHPLVRDDRNEPRCVLCPAAKPPATRDDGCSRFDGSLHSSSLGPTERPSIRWNSECPSTNRQVALSSHVSSIADTSTLRLHPIVSVRCVPSQTKVECSVTFSQ